jgi:sugar phosphate permease
MVSTEPQFIKKKVFYGWWIVLACFSIGLYVGGVIFYGFTAFVAPLRAEFGWSYTQISLAASLRGLEMGLFAPLVGFLVDRFGPRKIILCGTVTMGFGLILFAFTQSLAMFYGSVLLLAFGAGGCASVSLMSAVANWFKKDVGKALGVMVSGFGASGLLVPVIVFLIDRYGWRTALISLGVGMWAMGIPLSFVIRDDPEQYGDFPDGKPPDDPVPDPAPGGRRRPIRYRKLLTNRSFLFLNMVEAIRMMVLSAVVMHVMPYLSSMGIARSTAGFVAAAIPLFSIAGRFGLGWMGDLYEKRHVMALAFLLMGSGMLSFCWVRVGFFVFLFLLLFAPGFGGTVALRGAILSEYFGKDAFGSMLGIIMGSAAFGGIIGPTLAGWAFDVMGDYRLIWLVFFGLIGLGTTLALKMKRYRNAD